ncbi:sensor domain-containing diguanylate cyclase [Celerinatantimonas diazotrophica]|uniref:diguanylate cyclase n=1 Tax=Celerinatantimonas diazotrophica TaxID=412034 RepID=A0A4R1K3W2_9GAMM|nr:sensor domain-containing diguanylate cyclase [Celerinatantimonas diazotrophica]TCK58796.1 PAS domain S-box-containing protein/diguanylate cyclase (GGDEF)-like protein [Celerinatantimonas diazotrophica]CAG9297428.1 hypothetical protein CEDIAZO_02609 [Celerinatantimonas diazotrophica]
MDIVDYDFLNAAFDTLSDNICIINASGDIVYVNASWIQFGCDNELVLERSHWIGVNYLDACHDAPQEDLVSKRIIEGIEQMLAGKVEYFECEYPCHSPEEKLWFIVSLKRMYFAKRCYLVISHHNITRRKLAEDEVKRLANTDFLTGALTRAAFDRHANSVWDQICHLSKKFCIAMLDVDDFKSINDNYGHIFGDDCLRHIGVVIKSILPASNEIVFARYGGEEFILYTTRPFSETRLLVEQIRQRLSSAVIDSEQVDDIPELSVSIGLVELKPCDYDNLNQAIDLADHFLYQAKKQGKNCVISVDCKTLSASQ